MLSDGHLEIKTSPATATISYKAKFDNTDDTLWPGQFVDVRIQFAIRRN
jgi:multidrug efflux system membrane fusion protein